VSGKEPSARWGHTTTLLSDTKTFIVVGGHDGNNMLNDVFSFDTASSTWSALTCKGTPPSARAGHTTDRVGKHLVLFGGGNGVKILNDVHILDLDTLTWNSPSHLDNPPTARCAHTTALVDESQHQLILYGGGDGQRRFKDLYILNVDKLLKQEENKQATQHRGAPQKHKAQNDRVASTSSSHTPHVPPSSAIVSWLENIGMAQYAPHFVREEINMDILPFITEQHLAEQLGVVTIGARLRIMRAIERLAPNKQDRPLSRSQEVPLSRSQEGLARQDSSHFQSNLGARELSRSQELSKMHPQAHPHPQAEDIAALQQTIEKLVKTVANLSSSLQSMGIPVAAPEL
jgi:SAM domain (Sterile alpha motif)/Galactose oxidase, central domain